MSSCGQVWTISRLLISFQKIIFFNNYFFGVKSHSSGPWGNISDIYIHWTELNWTELQWNLTKFAHKNAFLKEFHLILHLIWFVICFIRKGKLILFSLNILPESRNFSTCLKNQGLYHRPRKYFFYYMQQCSAKIA